MAYYRRTTRTTRPVRKTLGRKKTTYGRKKFVSPGKILPRYNASRSRYYKNRAINSMLNKFAENKLNGLTAINEQNPSPIQLGALAQQISLVLGDIPSQWSGFTNLDGIAISQGTQAGQYIGDYAYFCKSTVSLEIDMKKPDTTGTAYPPLEFRVIVGKARRSVYPSGITKDSAKTLFLDEEGNEFGAGSSGKNGTDLMRLPLNKRAYTILKDNKFCLSPLLDASTATGYTGRYPPMKRMLISLPHYKKVHMNSTTSKPDDYDYHWFIIIYARSLNKDESAGQWELNLRGTTSWKDM